VRVRNGVITAILAAALVTSVPTSSHADEEKCVLCHSQVAVEHRTSAHAFEDMGCVSCHGGDPAATVVDEAHEPPFVGIVQRADIPGFCGECHADPLRMADFGLPADQLALYQISGHGRELATGNLDVAVCTDCHGLHDVQRADAPDSPTHPRNIPQTCGTCHDAAGPGIDVLAAYKGSIHDEALQEANPRAPSCVGCHSSHGAAPPGSGTVDRVCGQCHVQARAAFRQSPHSNAMVAAGEAECAACHGSHAVVATSHDMWSDTCSECHEDDSRALATATRIVTLMQQTEAEMVVARASIERARGVPLDVRDYETRMEMAGTFIEEARPRTHSLDPDAVEELTRKARSIARQVESGVAGELHVIEGRSLVVVFIWLYILITVAALQLYRRSLR
jgi:hypothetical protein